MTINNEEEYERALSEAADLMDAVPGTAEGQRLVQLVELLEAYEAVHWPVGSTNERPKLTGGTE